MMTDQSKVAADKPQWDKPELKRLGTIRNIAQGPLPVDQANNNKRS